jgi:hypothetical protein
MVDRLAGGVKVRNCCICRDDRRKLADFGGIEATAMALEKRHDLAAGVLQ